MYIGFGKGFWFYDVNANEWREDRGANSWTADSKPLPRASLSSACINAFYDPVFNAHFYHAAGDSGGNGSMFAYRVRAQR